MLGLDDFLLTFSRGARSVSTLQFYTVGEMGTGFSSYCIVDTMPHFSTPSYINDDVFCNCTV